jgi:hypothetical protein
MADGIGTFPKQRWLVFWHGWRWAAVWVSRHPQHNAPVISHRFISALIRLIFWILGSFIGPNIFHEVDSSIRRSNLCVC